MKQKGFWAGIPFTKVLSNKIFCRGLDIRVAKVMTTRFDNISTEYEKTQDVAFLVALYNESTSNYEKLQIYRIIFHENNGNRVVRKFVNETFHVENDYLFQLNPREYDTISQYIIDECDKDIMAIPRTGN